MTTNAAAESVGLEAKSEDDVKAAELQEFSDSETALVAEDISEPFVDPPARAAARLSRIQDVPVKVTAVLGRKRIPVADLMRLSEGDIIELDRRVGEPIDLYVNDRLIARGELVMVDGALGVTMTEIVNDE